MKKLKGKSLLTMFMVLALLLVSSASMVFADFNAFLVKTDDGKFYEYNQAELNTSYLAWQINPDAAGADMYKQFLAIGGNTSVVALGDSVKGWMDYAAAQNASLAAQIAGIPFVINDYLATPAAPVYAGTVTDPIVVDPSGQTHDLAAYNAAVADANSKVEADYTAASWANLQTALANNVVTAANTQAEIDAATIAINDAIDALVLKPTGIAVTSVVAVTDTTVETPIESGVRVDSAMKINFSEALAAATVTSNTVKLYKVEGNVPVLASTITLSTDKKSITFTPSLKLTKGIQYKLVLDATIASEADPAKTLGEAKEFTFATNDVAVVTNYKSNGSVTNISQGYNVTDSAAGQNLNVEFDTFVDAASVNVSNVKLYNNTTSAFVPITATVNANNQVRVQWLENIDPNTLGRSFTITMNNLKTATGADVMPVTFNFVTNSATPSVSALTDVQGTSLIAGTTPATAVEVNPLLTPVNVGIAGTYKAGLQINTTFNVSMKEATLNATNITMTKVENEVETPVLINTSYTSGNRTLTITPQANLEESKTYKLTIKKDVESTIGAKPASDIVYYVKTYDLTAPVVTNVESTNGFTGLQIGQQQRITITLSEPIGRTDGAQSITDNVPRGSNDGALSANESVGLLVSGGTAGTAGEFIDLSGAGAVTRSTDKKSIIVTFTPSEAVRNKTFILTIGGKSATNEYVGDLTNATATQRNALAENYTVTFTTQGTDTTAPTVVGSKVGTSYASGSDLNGKTNVYTDNHDIFVRFNEQINVSGAPITLTNTTAGTDYTLKWAAPADSGILTAGLLADGTDDTITVTSDANVNVGMILKITGATADSNPVAYAIVKAKPGANVLTLTQIYRGTTAITTGVGSKIEALTGVTVSDAATDAKNMVIDLATVNNAGALTADSAQRLSLMNTIEDKFGNKLAQVNSNFTTGSAGNTTEKVDATQNAVMTNAATPVAVNATLPRSGVDTNTFVLITFAKNVNSSTISTDNVVLKDSSNNVVASTITVESATQIKITPAADLAGNMTYQLSITGVKDTVGNSIADYVTTFTTKDAAKPTVTAVSPVNNALNVPVNEEITVEFSKAMDIATLTNAANKIQLAENAAGGTNVPVSITYDPETFTATIRPVNLLKTSTQYVLSLGNLLADTAANTLTAVNYQFTTSSNQQYAQITGATWNNTTRTMTLRLSNPLKDASAVKNITKVGGGGATDFATYFALGNGSITASGADAANSLTVAYTDGSTVMTITGGASVTNTIVTGSTSISVLGGSILDQRDVTLSTTPATITVP